MRRDQIWFTEKTEDQSSCLSPLTEFSPRKDEALEKGYLGGRYGGVPILAETLLDKVPMPRDNHPRERRARALQRKMGKRPPYHRVLIVCEGSRTEPLYFNEIRIQNRVPPVHISVMHSQYGTQPIQVVEFAHDKFMETRAFEWVFAVFDRDDHDTYNAAMQMAQSLAGALRNDENKKVRFIAVPSVPCFELWLLLHFANIQAYFHRDEIIARLRERIPGYSKGAKGIYAITQPDLHRAIPRAQHLQQVSTPFAGNEPYTNVDIVVTLLQSIRSKL